MQTIGQKNGKMESEDYYNRDKTYNYKAIFYSVIGILIIILLTLIYK